MIGRRVLVTGASGGVGRFAVQLGARAGAHVVALAGSPERAAGLGELGAAEVVFGLDALKAPVDAVLDNVGGDLLAHTLDHVAPGGTVMSIGMASLQPTTIDFERMRQRAGGARIEAFVVGSSFGVDLAHLVALLHAGALDPQIGWRGPWDQVRGRRGRVARAAGTGQGRAGGDRVSLSGQRVVVIGGTSGMGRATAGAAAAAGAQVIAAGRRAAAERAAAPGVTHATVDVTTSRRCGLCSPAWIASTTSSFPPRRVARTVARPGSRRGALIRGRKLLGTWMCARYAAPLMTAGGSMTFITGVAAVRPPGTPRW